LIALIHEYEIKFSSGFDPEFFLPEARKFVITNTYPI